VKVSEEIKEKLHKDLLTGLTELKINTTHDQQLLLVHYLCLLQQWNRAYNLTAVKDIDDMLNRHILDSLIIAQYCKGDHFIDIGTGAGLPGIPLAILFPEKKFTLLDSNGKKTRFLFHVKTTLDIANVDVVQARVESYIPQSLFDGVLSRAFASIGDMLAGSEHLLVEQGRFYAMKGLSPTEELSDLPKHIHLESTNVLQVPGVDAERHLVILQKNKT